MVKEMKVIFRGLTLASQVYSPGDQHMISTVHFDLDVGGNLTTGLQSIVKQTVGSDVRTDPLEVEFPQTSTGRYSGQLNYDGFRDAAVAYYRRAVSIHGPPVGSITLKDVSFQSTQEVTLGVAEQGPGGW